MNEKDIANILRKISLGIISITLFAFPILFTTVNTDPFTLPRQVFIVIAASLLIVLWAAISVLQRKIVLKTNPFMLPLGLFTVVILASAILSRNMYDSLAVSIPVIACFILFFVLVNTVSDRRDFFLVGGSLLLGAVVSTVISILYFFQIYILPISATQNKYFTTFGSPIQHIIFLLPLLIICGFAFLVDFKRRGTKLNYDQMFTALSGAVLLLGVGIILYQIITAPTKPVLLPYTYGFQIATASISQDSSRFLLALPFGSGYGTFLSDYTRFKFPTINTNPQLWSYQFTYSSSFVLELLTTAGVLGFLAYLFVVYRILRTRARQGGPVYLGIVTILILSFFLPFSLIEVFLLFVLIGIYTSMLVIMQDKRIDTVRLSLVAFKDGFLSMEETSDPDRRYKKDSRVLPGIVAAVLLLIAGYTSYLAANLFLADMKIARSLNAQVRTNGEAVYNLQRDALIQFPYRSDYYRLFSQLNLGLASTISQSVPQGQTASPQIQQTVSQLLQQAVNNARTAVAFAPVTAVNWENLASIYRNLIGVGQNADQFSIATMNQAIALDPSNPLFRIELGGIYYQMGQFDAAQTQFAEAIRLKPDFANAYYNLGHAYESKGDNQAALSAYQAALSLLTNDSDKKRLQSEIDALSKKGAQATGQNRQQNTVGGNAQNQPKLELTTPTSAPVPTGTQVKVPPPPTSAVATPTPIVSATPTP